MNKGTFFIIDDADLLELFIYEFGPSMVFKSGRDTMARHAEHALAGITVYMYNYPGDGRQDMLLKLAFASEDGAEVAKETAKLINTTAQQVDDWIQDTWGTLCQTRQDHGDLR